MADEGRTRWPWFAPAEAAINLDAYLARIGLTGPIPLDAEGLAKLQRAHRLAIAFENFDIPLGRGISLAPEKVFDKLVTRRRGGYCFEQNQLFLSALQKLGFEARPLLARVWLGAGPNDTPPRTHTLNLVRIDGQDWIADAGFGGSYTPPMPLIDGHVVETSDGAAHRLVADADHGWTLERRGRRNDDRSTDDGGSWQRQYSFTTDPVFAMDLAMANHWTATAYQTRFTSFVIASRATETGFSSLVDRGFTRDGEAKELGDPQSWRETLANDFGIHLTEDEIAALGLFGRSGG